MLVPTALLSASLGAHCTATCPASWGFAGPSAYYERGDDLKITSAGAINNVVQAGNGTWFVGTVNGGVWKSDNINTAVPAWNNVLDGQPVTCSSISALHIGADPDTVWAGCGGSVLPRHFAAPASLPS